MRASALKISILLILPILFFGCGYFPRLLLPNGDPLTAEEHNNLGVAYESEGKHELALREYQRALDKDSSLVVPLVNMGNVYFKMGNFEKAEESYLAALEKDEKNIEAANNLASLYIALNRNYHRALKYLVNSISSLDTSPAYALDTLGVLYFRVGDTATAKKMLLRACEKAGDDKSLIDEIETHLRDIGEEGCPRVEQRPVSLREAAAPDEGTISR